MSRTMTTVNIYLNFDGNCEVAFNFYKSVFGGEFPYVGRVRDMPIQEGLPAMSAKDLDKIVHISLPISIGTILIGSDLTADWPGMAKENDFAVSICSYSQLEADRLFVELSAGGEVTTYLSKTFWGSYFGILTDKFGITWMITFEQQPK